jgi:hypothetical protein
VWICISLIPFQLGQDTSGTLSSMNKLLLEKEEECLLMLNNTRATRANTTAPDGKCWMFTESSGKIRKLLFKTSHLRL